MKKSLIMLAAAAILFAGCAKEPSQKIPAGEEITLEIEAGMPAPATKGLVDNDGNAAKANHWIFEVRDIDGKLFYREVKTPANGTLKQTFKVTLIKNQTFDLLFWADNNGGYYDTDDLTNVKLTNESTYAANDDARDAFTTCKTYKSTANEKIQAELTRPFAQINVQTNELPTLWKQCGTTGDQATEYEKFAPNTLVLKAIIPTSFNVQTQKCGELGTAALELTADESYFGYKDDLTSARAKSTYERHISPATLFMDYIFASKDQKDIVDMEFSFTSNFEAVDHKFTSIPLQRNYRTNILGNLMSNEAEWEVVINPEWYTPENNIYASTWGEVAEEIADVDEDNKKIVITTPEEFATIAIGVENGNTYEGWTIELGNDLDMAGKEWTPIGRYEPNARNFKGTFDGKNFTIKNITVKTADRKGNAIFGQVYSPCVIKNLNVTDGLVIATGTNTYTGGLVGHGYATIENCSFKGTVKGGNQVAGIAASGGFTIKNCTFDGSIECKYWGVAGIVGNCQDGGPIEGNTVKGTIIGVSSETAFVGSGIVGCPIYSKTPIKNNYNGMKITYNGEDQVDYPIVGVYNIDDSDLTKSECLLENLATAISGNTWDKTIYTKDSYSIKYNTGAPTVSGYMINYNAATTAAE